MDYYYCRNCGWYFTKKHRSTPSVCPNCKEPYFIKNVDKQTYLGWLAAYKYSDIWKEIQQEKYEDRIWNSCMMIWKNYEEKIGGC